MPRSSMSSADEFLVKIWLTERDLPTIVSQREHVISRFNDYYFPMKDVNYPILVHTFIVLCIAFRCFVVYFSAILSYDYNTEIKSYWFCHWLD